MSQSINIIKIIEENPSTKLSKPYEGKLINKLKDNFSTTEQQLFISSFYCYLNYKSDDFVIDLDDIWGWLGFTRKDSAKKCLEKYFKVETDYKIVFRQLAENLQGGRPSEKIMLSIKTFKKMCLKANTSKANEIHEYYIKLEETLHEIIDEESNELRLQLQEKKEEIKDIQKDKHQFFLDKCNNLKCIYLAKLNFNEKSKIDDVTDKEDIFIKIGSTFDLIHRKNNLKDVFGEFIFLDVIDCGIYFREIEQNILTKVKKYKYTEKINNHVSKEVVKLSNEFNYNQLLKIIKDEIKKYNELIYENDKITLEKERLATENKKLDIENKKLDIINLLLGQNDMFSKDEIMNIIKQLKTSDDIIPTSDDETIDTHIEQIYARGRIIQCIDPNNLNCIIKTYPSMIYALRDQSYTYVKRSIQKAIKNNYIYRGYRWMFAEHNQDSTIVYNIQPTVKSVQVENATIIQLNQKKDTVINIFIGITKLKTHVKLGLVKINKIIDEKILYQDSYFVKEYECPANLLEIYKSKNQVDIRVSTKAKPVKQINIATNAEILYRTMTDASLKTGKTYKTISNLIKNGNAINGFTWKFVV